LLVAIRNRGHSASGVRAWLRLSKHYPDALNRQPNRGAFQKPLTIRMRRNINHQLKGDSEQVLLVWRDIENQSISVTDVGRIVNQIVSLDRAD
jgi:hypothetical protein